MNLQILTTEAEADYELLDSGEGQKLERFGKMVLARPDPQALWPKRLPQKTWGNADGTFDTTERSWKFKGGAERQWAIEFADLKFVIRPSAFKHVGIFPEQKPNWQWMGEKIKAAGRKVSVLNLFGYTGGATLTAAAAGAEVAHLDASKAAIGWARENAALSGLSDKPVRWILDDARIFVKREIKRGRHYDGIILDPPAFGRGPKGEVWKIEDDFLELLDLCKQALSPEPLFFLVNGYASGYSALGYANALSSLFDGLFATLEAGELALVETADNGRLLPAGIFARLSRCNKKVL